MFRPFCAFAKAKIDAIFIGIDRAQEMFWMAGNPAAACVTL